MTIYRTRCYGNSLVSMVILCRVVVDYTESVTCDFEQHMCGYNVARRKTGPHWEIKHVGKYDKYFYYRPQTKLREGNVFTAVRTCPKLKL